MILEPWPAFTISGCTGTAAGLVNGDYELQQVPEPAFGYRYYARGDIQVRQPDQGEWEVFNADTDTVLFVATVAADWPWQTAFAADHGSVGGTMAFAHKLLRPQKLPLDGGFVFTATLTTALTGANNDLSFDALYDGRIGNAIRIRYVKPATNNAALSVLVDGLDITVNLATNGSAQITSTASQVRDAIDASPAADIIGTSNPPGNDMSGVVTAMAWTNLSGGAAGPPLPPEIIDLTA